MFGICAHRDYLGVYKRIALNVEVLTILLMGVGYCRARLIIQFQSQTAIFGNVESLVNIMTTETRYSGRPGTHHAQCLQVVVRIKQLDYGVHGLTLKKGESKWDIV